MSDRAEFQSLSHPEAVQDGVFERFLESPCPPASSRISPSTRSPDPRDLRRRSRAGRDAAQHCIELARLLRPGDRAALLAVYRDGMTVKDLAALAPSGVHSARALRRRLRSISTRMLAPKFEFVAAFLEPADQSERRRLGLPTWPPTRRAVAQQCVINGLSMQKAARVLGITLHAVRREANAIHALFEATGT